MAEPASTPKRAQVQSAVLTATEELLAEGVPFADLNIEKIATRAGISRTAFYFYFSDKRELLMRLTEDLTDALFEAADLWFSGEGDPAALLRQGMAGISDLYIEHRTLLRAVTEVSTYDQQVGGFWRGLMQRFADATQRRIEAEQAAGRAPAMPAAATAFSLVWMTERTFYERNVQELGNPQEILDAIVGIWLRAIYGRDAA
jgi:AcrR family transcriptional regulator